MTHELDDSFILHHFFGWNIIPLDDGSGLVQSHPLKFNKVHWTNDVF